MIFNKVKLFFVLTLISIFCIYLGIRYNEPGLNGAGICLSCIFGFFFLGFYLHDDINFYIPMPFEEYFLKRKIRFENLNYIKKLQEERIHLISKGIDTLAKEEKFLEIDEKINKAYKNLELIM